MPALWIQTAELFPTELRATGHSSSAVAGRIGALLAIFWVDDYTYSHFFVGLLALVCVGFFASVVVLGLPDTSGVELDRSPPQPNELTHLLETIKSMSRDSLDSEDDGCGISPM